MRPSSLVGLYFIMPIAMITVRFRRRLLDGTVRWRDSEVLSAFCAGPGFHRMHPILCAPLKSVLFPVVVFEYWIALVIA
jgi:hypothetical protein